MAKNCVEKGIFVLFILYCVFLDITQVCLAIKLSSFSDAGHCKMSFFVWRPSTGGSVHSWWHANISLRIFFTWDIFNPCLCLFKSCYGSIRVSVEHARGSGRRGGRDDRNDRDHRDRGSRRSNWMDNK